jgi:tetratricopeptide (TPR) repeat protein
MQVNNPVDERKRMRDSPPAGSPAERVLAHAQAGREVVQDFVPLAESLEWNLGQEYLRQRGNKAFLSDSNPVPFVVNNDGTLSRSAADVFFNSLLAADKKGSLENEIFVLELGIGVGLFARYFLDSFEDLCRRHRKDYYGRLCYVAADRSERMLLDLLRHGVLAKHPGRYRVRRIDALEPGRVLSMDVCFRMMRGRPLRAVFLNYLLDCLPAAVLDLGGSEVRQLCVRTCVARGIRLADHTDLSASQLRARADALDPRGREELLEVYGLFASEYDCRPVDPRTLPYGEFAVEFGRTRARKVLLNFGAIQCLERLLGLLHDDGFILMNEYGFTQLARDEDFEHQRFSLTTAVGLNFPLLKAYFAEGRRAQWFEAGGDSRGICSRMIGHKVPHEAGVRFYERFSDAAHQRLRDPIEKARTCAKSGRFELAAGFYREALHAQPGNWVLLNEVSEFLTHSLRDPQAGADLAKLALGLNPRCSADLWNALGDALFEWGRTAEARSAYLTALDVNGTDVRARYNLAWVHTREGDYPAALQRIAEAFAFDKSGAYRDRLLQKQQEIVARLAQRHQQEYLQMVNLVSRHAGGKHDEREGGGVLPPSSVEGQE